MAEMRNALSFFGNDVNSPLRSFTLSPKHSKQYHIPKTGNETNPASTLGIILDPHHTLVADALVIRRNGTDGLLKQQII
ncbi:MAG: hypothetical protein ACR2NE_00960 [Pirellulales bacterium]